MESKDILEVFHGTRCMGCQGHKSRHVAFCRSCYFQLPRALKSALWQRFGDGFEKAFMGSLSWFREHPLQGEHRAKQKALFEDKA